MDAVFTWINRFCQYSRKLSLSITICLVKILKFFFWNTSFAGIYVVNEKFKANKQIRKFKDF